MSIRNYLLVVGVVCVGASHQIGAEKRAEFVPKPTFQRWSEDKLVKNAWERIQNSIGAQKGDIAQVSVEYHLDRNGVLCSVDTKVYPIKYREKKQLTREILCQDGQESQVIKVRYAPGKNEVCVRQGSTGVFAFLGGATLKRVIPCATLQQELVAKL